VLCWCWCRGGVRTAARSYGRTAAPAPPGRTAPAMQVPSAGPWLAAWLAGAAAMLLPIKDRIGAYRVVILGPCA
jgi:hypothetical protein